MESRNSESNYGYSSESNYGRTSQGSSFSSESNYGSSLSSESALESRSSIDSVGRGIPRPNYKIKDKNTETLDKKPQYNSLDDIDKLIERLETSMATPQVTSERVNKVLERRKQKIELLKGLVAEARQVEAEQKLIQQLEQENSELDDAINSINRGFHR